MKRYMLITLSVLLMLPFVLFAHPPVAPQTPGAAGGGISNVVEDVTPQLGGDLDLNGNNIDFPTTANISDVLDEDAMGSNSNTKLSTQQSIKAYVDNAPVRFTEGVTLQTFGAADATPDVTNGGTSVVRLWATGGTPTITDFDDGDDHSEFVAGDWFIVRVEHASVFDMSANVNMEGNAGVDYTGSTTQITYLLWIYDDSRWNCQNLFGMIDPITIGFSAIEMTTLKASELNDTSDPHLLTVSELKGHQLTNSESTGADEWDFPAQTEGWSFLFIIEAVQNVILDPNGAEQLYLNGTQMAAGEAIVNEAPTIGESIACRSSESAIYCESKYSDFAEDTP